MRIDKQKIRKCLLRKGMAACQVSVKLHYAPSWLGTCIYRGRINEDGCRALETLGIKREEYKA